MKIITAAESAEWSLGQFLNRVFSAGLQPGVDAVFVVESDCGCRTALRLGWLDADSTKCTHGPRLDDAPPARPEEVN